MVDILFGNFFLFVPLSLFCFGIGCRLYYTDNVLRFKFESPVFVLLDRCACAERTHKIKADLVSNELSLLNRFHPSNELTKQPKSPNDMTNWRTSKNEMLAHCWHCCIAICDHSLLYICIQVRYNFYFSSSTFFCSSPQDFWIVWVF